VSSADAEHDATGAAHALERELYWAGDPVPDGTPAAGVTADSLISQRWYELEQTLLWEYTQRFPEGEDVLQVGSRPKRWIKRVLFRVIRPLVRRYDRVGANIAHLGFETAQRQAGDTREVEALRGELELLTREVHALRDRLWPAPEPGVQPLEPSGGTVVEVPPGDARELETMPWRWDDEALDALVAIDVFGGLAVDVPVWLDESWRVLRPGGLLIVRLPAWNNPRSYRSPTRTRVVSEETFAAWDPDSEQHARFATEVPEGRARWWKVRQVLRDDDDLRFVLEKRG